MKIYQTFLFIQKIWDSPNTIYYFFRGYDGHILSEVESYIWSNDLSINLFQTLGDPRIGAMFLWSLIIISWVLCVFDLIYHIGNEKGFVGFSKPNLVNRVVVYGGGTPPGGDDDDNERRRRFRQKCLLIGAGCYGLYKGIEIGYLSLKAWHLQQQLDYMAKIGNPHRATNFAEYLGLHGQQTFALYHDRALFDYAKPIIKTNWLHYLDYISERGAAPYRNGCSLALLTSEENIYHRNIIYHAFNSGYVRVADLYNGNTLGSINPGANAKIHQLFVDFLKANDERAHVILKTLEIMRKDK